MRLDFEEPATGAVARGMDHDMPPDQRTIGTTAGKGRKHDPRWAKVLVIVGAVLVIVSGLALGASQFLVNSVEDSVVQDNLLGDAGSPPGKADPLAGPLNVLMIGLDARPGEAESASRADSIIILHVPATHDRAYLISVPRDLMVQVKPYSRSRYAGGRAKMTESFFYGGQNGGGVKGGTELLALTIRDTLGVRFNAAAIINFQSFIKVIDAVGGVEMCFDETVTSKHLVMGTNGKPINIENVDNGRSLGAPITYPKGQCRHLAAWQALDYSRQRYGLANGDYDRQRHQQQLIKAIVKKATSAGIVTNPAKLNNVIKAAGSAFVIDTNGVPLADFVFNLKNIGTNGMITVKTNAGKLNSQNIDGISYETLSPLSKTMFKALNDDKLNDFLAAHPEYLSQS